MSDWWNVTPDNREAVQTAAQLAARVIGTPVKLHCHGEGEPCSGDGCTVVERVRLGRGERLEDASGKRLAP